MRLKAQPTLAVRNVTAAARWYTHLFGSGSPPSDHDAIYRRIYVGNELVLQLRAWDAKDHVNKLDPERSLVGYGVLVWFEVDDYAAVATRVGELGAHVIHETVNPNARRRELWLRDTDGYVVVVASPDGSAVPESAPSPVVDRGDLSLESIIHAHVLKVLDLCEGVRTTAAETLGIDRKTLYRMLRRWQMMERPGN
jgi:catechol 2,3-dioxygenase-like lactoylglutathione lyase family enzyme